MEVKLPKIRSKRNKRIGGFVVQASKHIMIMCFFAVLFSGLITGNLFVKADKDTYNSVGKIFESYLSFSEGQTLIKVFFDNLLINALTLGIFFIFGLCAVGFPVPAVLIFIKGLSIGALSAFMYTEYALKGFGFCTLAFYPVQIISCLVWLTAGKEAFNMSKTIFTSLIEQRTKQTKEPDFKLYLLRFFVLFAVIVLISLLTALISVYLLKLFEF